MNLVCEKEGPASPSPPVPTTQTAPKLEQLPSATSASKVRTVAQVNYFHGFDYLRIVFTILVIVGHSDLLKWWAIAREGKVGPGANLWDYVYFNFQSCAVPAFMMIAMILFLMKPPSWARTKDRLIKLFYLYGFWVGAWVFHTKVTPAPTFLGVIEFGLRGGGWLFYFLAVLIICTLVGWGAASLPRLWQWIGLGITLGVMLLTYAWTHQDYRWVQNQYYWLPTLFTSIPFVVVLLIPYLKRLSEQPRQRYFWIGLLVILSVAAAVLEWHYAAPSEIVGPDRHWLPKNGRLSIYFGGMALVLASLGIKKPIGGIGAFFARNTLGIYCLHPFVLMGCVKFATRILGGRAPGWEIPFGLVLLLIGCALVSEFLRRAFQSRLV